MKRIPGEGTKRSPTKLVSKQTEAQRILAALNDAEKATLMSFIREQRLIVLGDPAKKYPNKADWFFNYASGFKSGLLNDKSAQEQCILAFLLANPRPQSNLVEQEQHKIIVQIMNDHGLVLSKKSPNISSSSVARITRSQSLGASTSNSPSVFLEMDSTVRPIGNSEEISTQALIERLSEISHEPSQSEEAARTVNLSLALVPRSLSTDIEREHVLISPALEPISPVSVEQTITSSLGTSPVVGTINSQPDSGLASMSEPSPSYSNSSVRVNRATSPIATYASQPHQESTSVSACFFLKCLWYGAAMCAAALLIVTFASPAVALSTSVMLHCSVPLLQASAASVALLGLGLFAISTPHLRGISDWVPETGLRA